MESPLKCKLPENYVNKISENYGKFENITTLIPDISSSKYEAKFFSILSDPTRLNIVKILVKDEVCVCIISDLLKLDTTLISHHLSKLKYLDLIDERRDGKWIFYRAKKKLITFFDKCDDLLNSFKR